MPALCQTPSDSSGVQKHIFNNCLQDKFSQGMLCAGVYLPVYVHKAYVVKGVEYF